MFTQDGITTQVVMVFGKRYECFGCILYRRRSILSRLPPQLKQTSYILICTIFLRKPPQFTPNQSQGGSCAHTRPALRGIENHGHGGQIHDYTALVRLFLVTALSENNILFSAKDTKKQAQTKICLPFILFPNFPSAGKKN